MKKALILHGPAGVGKSTIGVMLKKTHPDWALLDIDKFKHVISQDSSPLRAQIAHNVGIYFIQQLIDNGFDMIIEEIFREEYYQEVTDLLRSNDYQVISVFLDAPVETVVARDASREKNKGRDNISKVHSEIHSYPEDIILDAANHSAEELNEQILKLL